MTEPPPNGEASILMQMQGQPQTLIPMRGQMQTLAGMGSCSSAGMDAGMEADLSSTTVTSSNNRCALFCGAVACRFLVVPVAFVACRPQSWPAAALASVFQSRTS